MTSIIKNPRRIFTNGSSDSGVDSRVTTLENNEYKILYFEAISTATGTITIPTGATILLDQFYEGGDAIVETLVNGQPSGQSPLTASGTVVSVSSFDTSGNYTLSGAPSSFDVALVYILKIKAIDYSNLNIDNIMSMENVVEEYSKVIAKQTIDSSHSGSVSPTIITNVLIPANSMGTNDIAFLEGSFYKTGTTDTAIWNIYIGPNSNSLTDASVLFNSSNTAAQMYSQGHRTIVNKNSQSSNYAYQQSGGVENPWANFTTARVAINQNFANDLYLMVAVTMGGTTDTGGVDWIYMTKQ